MKKRAAPLGTSRNGGTWLVPRLEKDGPRHSSRWKAFCVFSICVLYKSESCARNWTQKFRRSVWDFIFCAKNDSNKGTTSKEFPPTPWLLPANILYGVIIFKAWTELTVGRIMEGRQPSKHPWEPFHHTRNLTNHCFTLAESDWKNHVLYW